MSRTLRVRTAGAEDADLIADLHIRSWRSAYQGILASAYLGEVLAADRLRVWRGRMRDGVSQIVKIAEFGSTPVGFACLVPDRDPHWGTLIDNLHVAPDVHARGIGALVLGAALDDLLATASRSPIYLTVFERNARARSVYDRWGGHIARRFNELQPDGREHPVLLYAWPSAPALRARLRRKGPVLDAADAVPMAGREEP